MSFEDTTKYDANFDVKELKSLKNDELGFKIAEQSDEEPFKVVISDMSLYMDRNLPAGGYDLIMNTTMSDAFMDATLFGTTKSIGEELFDGADEFDTVVKEDFVNVITGDADTFVTKVKNSISNIGIDKGYFQKGDFKQLMNFVKGKAKGSIIWGIIFLLPYLYTRTTRLDYMFGALFVLCAAMIY
jgi:hypothetical protein